MQENQEVGPTVERSDEKQTKKSPEDMRTYKYKPQKKKKAIRRRSLQPPQVKKQCKD